MSKSIKRIGAFILSVLLLYIGFKYLISKEQRDLFFAIPLTTLLTSVLICIPSFILSGIELRFLYNKVSKIKLTAYDTATLPIVINLWGVLIPFQGSFIYTTAYIHSKYKKGIGHSAKVYLLSFSISLALAGLIGILYASFSNIAFSIYFIMLSALLVFNPLGLVVLEQLLSRYKDIKHEWLSKIINKASKLFGTEHIDKKLLFYLVLLKICNIATSAIWAYWVTITFRINLTVIQLLLILLLTNLTALIQITPGNIGVNQIASGGLAILVGGTMNDGFFLSAFQFLSNFTIAITLGSLFTFINMKYFSWQYFKSLLAKKGKDKNIDLFLT